MSDSADTVDRVAMHTRMDLRYVGRFAVRGVNEYDPAVVSARILALSGSLRHAINERCRESAVRNDGLLRRVQREVRPGGHIDLKKIKGAIGDRRSVRLTALGLRELQEALELVREAAAGEVFAGLAFNEYCDFARSAVIGRPFRFWEGARRRALLPTQRAEAHDDLGEFVEESSDVVACRVPAD